MQEHFTDIIYDYYNDEFENNYNIHYNGVDEEKNTDDQKLEGKATATTSIT